MRAEGDLLLAVEGEAAAVRERDAGLRARREAEAAEARDERRGDLRERARRRRVRRALLVDDDDEPGAGPAAVDERACLAFVDGVLPRSLVGDGGRDEGPGPQERAFAMGRRREERRLDVRRRRLGGLAQRSRGVGPTRSG